MKIYNEITTIFNDDTGQWDTISEDSYEHSGEIALMAEGGAGLPANAMPLSEDEKIVETVKTTTGYFTNGDGTMEGISSFTGSLADSNEKYYFNVNQLVPTDGNSETQLSVTFGHILGSGSDATGDTGSPIGLKSETDAIYSQIGQLLLDPSEASFGISKQGTAFSTNDEYIYVLVGKRNRFKDRINKAAWTLSLSGSDAVGTGSTLHLTDDSKTVSPVSTPAGNRYNIVSGAVGVVEDVATLKTYGWFYPDMGMMVFGGLQMSASLPGHADGVDLTASFHDGGEPTSSNANVKSCSGFGPNLDNTGNAQNAMRLINCMKNMGATTSLRMRAEEDQTQINYFCRIKPKDSNFSNNPTFVSGSLNKIRNADMVGNPQVFISGVGLYNAVGQLVAVAKLSSPLKKNFASEATIKVKLTY